MATTMQAKTEFDTFVRLYAATLITFAACVTIIAAVGAPLVGFMVACVFAWSLERTAKHYLDRKFPGDSTEAEDEDAPEGRTRNV